MAREALRCAEKGMSMNEILPRVKHVEGRAYSFTIVSLDTKKSFAKWGRIFKTATVKLTAEEVARRETCALGWRPVSQSEAAKLGAGVVMGRFPIGGSRVHPQLG